MHNQVTPWNHPGSAAWRGTAIWAWLVTFSVCLSAASAGDHHTLRFVTSSGYPHSFKTMAFSPDGSELAVCTSSDQVSFIRTRDGEITGHFKKVTPFSMNYSTDGRRLFMISEYGSQLLDTRSRTSLPFQRKRQPGFIGIRLDKRNGKLMFAQIQAGGPVDALGSVKVGDELVGIGKGKSDRLQEVIGWSATAATERIGGPAGSYVRLSVIHKGDYTAKNYTVRRLPKRISQGRLVFAEFDGEAISEKLVWCMRDGRHNFDSAATGQTLSAIETEEIESRGQYSVSPDATQFAILADYRSDQEGSGIELYDLASQKRTKSFDFSRDSWLQLAFSHDGSHLFIRTHATIEILDLESGEYDYPLKLGNRKKRRRSVDEMAVSSTGMLAVATRGSIELWNPLDKSKIAGLASYTGDEISEMHFSPDGKWLAYHNGKDGVLHIIDVSYHARSVETGNKQLVGSLR